MKALVLCGGIPQIALIEDLKSRGIYVLLADMNPKVVAREYADEFFPVSVLDVDTVRDLAKREQVDFVITVCADQVLQVVAQVSEELGLPCYIDFDTAKKVSNKSYMKEVFIKKSIPTSKYVILDTLSKEAISNLNYPIIVKPVDSYSSRGVKKVFSYEELNLAFEEAVSISRTNTAVVEEFFDGDELTVDVYIENGKAHILCVSNIDKIGNSDKFVIHRTRHPANISNEVYLKVEEVVQRIADAFNLKNSPMLVQLIVNEESISVVEFCARTGGGDKFRLIKKISGFDVVKAVVDLTLGYYPHIDKIEKQNKCVVDEFLYCKKGVLNRIDGLPELMSAGIISEYFILKEKGYVFDEIKSSGDRVAYFTVEDSEISSVREKLEIANERLRIYDCEGNDILRHDLINDF